MDEIVRYIINRISIIDESLMDISRRIESSGNMSDELTLKTEAISLLAVRDELNIILIKLGEKKVELKEIEYLKFRKK